MRCVVRGEPWLVVIGEGMKGRTQCQAKLVLRWKSLGTGRRGRLRRRWRGTGGISSAKGRYAKVGFEFPTKRSFKFYVSCEWETHAASVARRVEGGGTECRECCVWRNEECGGELKECREQSAARRKKKSTGLSRELR